MLVLVALTLIGVILCSTIGFSSLKTKMMEIPMVKTLSKSFLSDWIKAMFVLAGTPIFLFYLSLSAVNQFVRVHLTGNWITEEVDAAGRKRWFTRIACTQLDSVWKWRWTSVLNKTIDVGLFYICIQVGVGK